MQSNPVGWFEIYVQNMNRAKAFYESVFDMQLQKLDATELDMWAFPMMKDKTGASGALVKMDGVNSGGNSTIVYFMCSDCGNEAAKVTKAGGRVHKGKMSIGQYGFIALVQDTEGNTFGLHSMK